MVVKRSFFIPPIFIYIALIIFLLIIGSTQFFEERRSFYRQISEFKDRLNKELIDRAGQLTEETATLALNLLSTNQADQLNHHLEQIIQNNRELLYLYLSDSEGRLFLRIDPRDKESLFKLQEGTRIDHRKDTIILRKTSERGSGYIIESITKIPLQDQAEGLLRLGFSPSKQEAEFTSQEHQAWDRVVKVAATYCFSGFFLIIIGLIVLTATNPYHAVSQWPFGERATFRINRFVINKVIVVVILLELLVLAALFLGQIVNNSEIAQILHRDNPINWFTAVQLLLAGVFASLHLIFRPYESVSGGQKHGSLIWIILFIGFTLGSLDEQFEFHEWMGAAGLPFMFDLLSLDWLKDLFAETFYWQSTSVLFIYAMGALMVAFFYIRINYYQKKSLLFFLLGIFLQCLALFNEHVFPLSPETSGMQLWAYIEEIAELFGSFCYMLSLLLSLLLRGGSSHSLF